MRSIQRRHVARAAHRSESRSPTGPFDRISAEHRVTGAERPRPPLARAVRGSGFEKRDKGILERSGAESARVHVRLVDHHRETASDGRLWACRGVVLQYTMALSGVIKSCRRLVDIADKVAVNRVVEAVAVVQVDEVRVRWRACAVDGVMSRR